MAVAIGGRAPQMIGVYTTFVVLTTIATALRVYCRLLLVKTFGADDYLAVAAWGVFIIFATFALSGVRHGTGQHVPDIQPPTELPIAIKFWWLCEPFYVLCNMLAKASIAVMLLRLTVIRTHRIIIWTVLIITELYSGFFFFLFIFQCQPSQYFWTQYTGGKGSCVSSSIIIGVFYGYSAMTCATDWIYATLPYFLVWKLQMDKRSKIVVVIILSLGAIASTATIIRLPYVHTMGDLDDFLYATVDVALWSCVETGLGITTMCLATLRPLLRKWLERTGFGYTPNHHKGESSAPRPGVRSGYMRGHGRGGSTGLEELDLGIRKTTRVSVDEFRRWNTSAQDADTDGESTKSDTSKTRITAATGPPVMNSNICPWDSMDARDREDRARDLSEVSSAWAEGRIRR